MKKGDAFKQRVSFWDQLYLKEGLEMSLCSVLTKLQSRDMTKTQLGILSGQLTYYTQICDEIAIDQAIFFSLSSGCKEINGSKEYSKVSKEKSDIVHMAPSRARLQTMCWSKGAFLGNKYIFSRDMYRNYCYS